MGLEMIPQLKPDARILEIGYGSGVVLYNLSSSAASLSGLDLDADPDIIGAKLAAAGVAAHLVRGSVLDMRGVYDDGAFDLVVSFSMLEHIHAVEKALEEIGRVTAANGVILIGMPAVNRFMEVAFRAIGFKNIEDYHVTTPRRVRRILRAQPTRWITTERRLPACVPFGFAIYHTFLMRKTA
jgi:ubiquinone/menaquinone biosynthesis C-methylase UbiE